MKLYIKLTVVAAVVMGAVIGTYSLIFNVNDDYVQAGAEENLLLQDAIYKNERNFIALCVDYLCPNGTPSVKAALCSVILNRMKNDGFPDTSAEIIFGDSMFEKCHKCDFSAVPSESALNAYDDAVSGMSPCPDALYFYTLDDVDVIIRKLPVMFTNGKYYFA